MDSTIELVDVRQAVDPFFADVRLLLETAFPPDERPVLDDARLARPGFHLLAVLSGGRFAGFHSHWDLGDFVFCEHVAIIDGMRGCGLGAIVDGTVARRLRGRRLVGEVELPDTEIARRRIALWERCGWNVNRRPYLQPAYAPGKSPVPMLLISRPGPLDAREFVRASDRIHRDVYRVAPIAAPSP